MAQTKIYWLHALTPLHVGSGAGVGFIDLPIMREKTTNWPVVPGSSVKGVLADHHGATDDGRKGDVKLRAAFGIADSDLQSANSGALVFTDARLVCLPVRSLYGTFAWVTSPFALSRLKRDLDAAGLTQDLSANPSVAGQAVLLPENSSLKDSNGMVYLEDLDFSAAECPDLKCWAGKIAESVFPGDHVWQELFRQRMAVVPDDSFNFFSEMATEVNARIRIQPETKTVAHGALWYEESLPVETILAGIAWCDRVYARNGAIPQPEELMQAYCSVEAHLQIGGKATVGKGRVRCLFNAPISQAGGSTDANT